MPLGEHSASFKIEQSQGRQRARIEDVLTDVLTPWAFGQHEEQRRYRYKRWKSKDVEPIQTLEDIGETVQYLTDEILAQAVPLPSPSGESRQAEGGGASNALQVTVDSSATLNELESHPLYTLVISALIEVLLFEASEATAAAPTVVEEILLAMRTPPAESSDPPRPKHKKGSLGECEICERMMPLTEHHLIPRSEHAKLSRQGRYTLGEMRSRLAMLCRPCHSAVHHMLPAEDLASSYNTVEALLEHDGVRKYGKYASALKERRSGYEGVGLKNKR